MKKIFFLLLWSVCFLFFARTCFAESNFNTTFDVTYSVSEDGNTHALFQGSLQNATDAYYASSYSLQTGFNTMTNIIASDNNGSIQPAIKKTTTGNAITLPFNYKAIGLGSTVHFSFSFDTPDVAKHVGNIWEINIPGIANTTDFSSFTVHLRVPQSFGTPSYIKPVQIGSSLDFTKDILGNGGISLAFGQQQTYGFNLTYHIRNDQLFPVTTEIALPPTTNYQQVAIDSITPKPNNVTLDKDGNWLAQYSLLPSQKMSVVAKGEVITTLTPQKELLSSANRKLYTQPDSYWEQTDQIKQLATELKTPRAIYDYVVGHLHYDFSRVAGAQQRLGAATVLNDPQSAVCLEFTDLFIALSRAAGIPAREIDGYAFTENTQERPLSLLKDVLHAWPEYYDDNLGTWVMVDPTWGNTTKGTDYFDVLDFDHVAFVVKGAKSIYPIPAGGYKFAGEENIKEVYVSFSPESSLPNPQASVDFTIAPTILSGVPINGSVLLTNAGHVLIPPQHVTVANASLTPHSQVVNTPAIPPFGNIHSSVAFDKTSFLTNMTVPITIQVGENKIVRQVNIYPFFLQKNIVIGGIIVVILCIIISIVTTVARRLSTS